MSRQVHVLDAWNGTTQTSAVLVFSPKEKADRALKRFPQWPGSWYAGIVKRTIR